MINPALILDKIAMVDFGPPEFANVEAFGRREKLR